MGIISLVLTLGFAAFALFVVQWALTLRTVVPAHLVHIVQVAGKQISYGAGQTAGNVYYRWPSWMPLIGLTVTVLPVNNFELELEEYEAFDLNKVPFLVDIVGFFRIEDTNLASQRIANFPELFEQLTFIVQGAVRTILAGSTIEEIMVGRSAFGDAFTKEVAEQLKAWGVVPVKSLELMDIKDTKVSKVIFNIMAKKQSFIEMESRKEVAENNRAAQEAEIEAQRQVDLQTEAAAQAVGERSAQKDQAVGVAQQQALQEVKAQQKVTMERDMAVAKVQHVEGANIQKEVAVVQAAEQKEVTIIVADGQLEEEKRKAEAVTVNGKAKAEAEKLMQLAPVEAQIVLAEKIAESEGYQKYLLGVEQIKANQAVGIANAEALKTAEVKIIANTGDAQSGVKSLGEVFTPKGGMNLGAMLEGFVQTPQGSAMANKFFGTEVA